MEDEEMSYQDFFPRMETWLQSAGIEATEILRCTQYVYTGDPVYLPSAKKDGKSDSPNSNLN